MSLRKLSGAAAAGSRESYASTNPAAQTASNGGSGSMSAAPPTPVTSGNPTTVGPSKAYSSHLAIQSDATKYRGKYKELKKKVRQIEAENDKLHYKTLRIKRNIQRMRLERAILYERLEAEINTNSMVTSEPAGLSSQTPFARAAGNPKNDPVSVARKATAAKPRPSHANSSESPAAPSSSNAPPRRVAESVVRPRRTMDYSPSPEEEMSRAAPQSKTAASASNGNSAASPDGNGTSGSGRRSAAAAAAAKHDNRPSMKITLKRGANNAHNGSSSSSRDA